VALAKIRVKERLAQDGLAVHDHVVHLAQRRLRARDEFEPLAAKAQPGQGRVQIGQLLAGILDLFAQAMDKVLDQFLFGQARCWRCRLLGQPKTSFSRSAM
jgi:hypothetical protein